MINGIVQGVGFRPFVYRLATELGLAGQVANTSQGVVVYVQGGAEAVQRFVHRLQNELPPLARIDSLSAEMLTPAVHNGFVIAPSHSTEANHALVPPDVSVCADCLAEFNTPSDRRYHYPFINCTNCGPRYSLIRAVPYDRPLTTMSAFPMCPDCLAEYENPANRRFHAQPNACPVCGPRLWLADSDGSHVTADDPLAEAAMRLSKGQILAVKGLGGFHLACDAANPKAVNRLRLGKVREAKPFAVMAATLERAGNIACISEEEAQLLSDPRRPIVLLDQSPGYDLAEAVSPENSRIGVMLPYTPLHARLMSLGPDVLVMTSGNLADEPMAYENAEALARLGAMVDGFLLHDRPIYNRCDDSVFQVVSGQAHPLRRSRGYAPEPLAFPFAGPDCLAVGASQKNAFCLVRGQSAFMGVHIGELETAEALAYFEGAILRMKDLLGVTPQLLACDAHPDYLSTQWAMAHRTVPLVRVQHHHAHIASVLAEHGRSDRVIGLALDGSGAGTDGAIWGGEVLIADLFGFHRFAHLAYRPMPGGDAAVRQPWRMALSYAWALWRSEQSEADWPAFWDWLGFWPLRDAVGHQALHTVFAQMENQINTPHTSSMGRLFDGVSALLGIKAVSGYEGQAAVMLEAAVGPEIHRNHAYAFICTRSENGLLISPDAVLQSIVDDLRSGLSCAEISRRFHAGVIDMLCSVCCICREKKGLNTVALSGGCFQNRLLLKSLQERLVAEGFHVLANRNVPANDGGLALGQAAVARMQWAQGTAKF